MQVSSTNMLLLCLAAITIQVPKGSLQEAVQRLSGQLKQPVAIVIDGGDGVAAFRGTVEDRKDLDRLLWNRAGLGSESEAYGYARAFDRGSMFRDAIPVEGLRPTLKEPTITTQFPEGLSVSTKEGEGLSLIGLASKLSRTLTFHWFYRDVRCAVQAEDVSESELLAVVAGAMGAKLIIGDAYTVDFQAGSFRRRAVATLQHSKVESSTPAAERRFLQNSIDMAAQALQQMTDAELTKLYEKAGNEVFVDAAPGSPLMRLALERVELFRARGYPENNPSPSMVESIGTMLDQVDFRIPPRVSIWTDGRCLVNLSTGREGSYVSF